MLHRPSLQSATPLEATGLHGDLFVENDIVWKHFRTTGLHICVIIPYFQHTVGLIGTNLDENHRINSLPDEGRRSIIVMGDFNISACTWENQDLETYSML